MRPSKLAFVVWVILIAVGCNHVNQVHVDPSSPYQKLSQYQFFKGDLWQLEPNTGVLPYDVISPLFSDYAEKKRFVWMPPGASARVVQADEVFVFPTGAVLIKNFYYPVDTKDFQSGRQILETRLLVKGEERWDALTYVWNEEQSEAYLDVAGDIKNVLWTDAEGNEREIAYIVPNKNQCKGCHEYKEELKPIGPRLSYLDKSYPYDGGHENQLQRWQQMDYLTFDLQGDREYKAIVSWSDTTALLEDRALSYLEINCGICHNEHGPAYVSGLYLTTDYQNDSQLGICKSPVSAGSGSGGRDYDVVPGKPEASILVYRMESTDPGEMMPELGRTLVHREGVDLIKSWILSLEGDCPKSL